MAAYGWVMNNVTCGLSALETRDQHRPYGPWDCGCTSSFLLTGLSLKVNLLDFWSRFLWAGCPFCCPANSMKILKTKICYQLHSDSAYSQNWSHFGSCLPCGIRIPPFGCPHLGIDAPVENLLRKSVYMLLFSASYAGQTANRQYAVSSSAAGSLTTTFKLVAFTLHSAVLWFIARYFLTND